MLKNERKNIMISKKVWAFLIFSAIIIFLLFGSTNIVLAGTLCIAPKISSVDGLFV